MSPRRKIDPAEETVVVASPAKRQWRHGLREGWEHRGRWRLAGAGFAAALLIAGAITSSALMLASHESDRRAAVKDVAVLDYVRTFMTLYTTLDPFHANDYSDRVLSYGTGDFAQQFKQHENEITVMVARAEPANGTVLDAGIEKWRDDREASVLVATKITTTGGKDNKTVIESGNRWVVTATKEGQQWKISGLVQVM